MGIMQRFKGKVKAAVLYLGSSASDGLWINAGAAGFVRTPNHFSMAGAPTNGTNGSFAGLALPGDLLTDTTGKNLYQNVNTLSSPTWSLFESSGDQEPVPQQTYNPVSTAPTANVLALTGANITGGTVKSYLNLTAALGAGAQATLPTVAQLVTAMQAAGITPVAGGSYEFEVMNSSSGNFAWTIATNTGWTLNGTMTVAQNTLRRFIITFSSLTAASLQSLGQYAIGSGI